MIDADQVKLQLQLLGKTTATTRYRAIWPERKDKIPGRKLPLSRGAVEQCASEGFNSYIVVGNGGDNDNEITDIPAAFGEWDDGDKTWQVRAWADAGLPPPTFQVDTGGKSIHHYWVFEESAPPAVWVEIQKRLIALAGFDRTLINPSRVMRLAGAPHQKTGQLAQVLNVTGARYNDITFLDSLPPVPEPIAALPEPREWASRSMDDIRAALAHVPPRPGAGTGTYAQYRNILWGLIKACEEAGGTKEDAVAMMTAHSPEGWDPEQVARSGGEKIDAATFWYWCREYGYKLERGPGEAKKTRMRIEAKVNPEAVGENMWLPLGTGWDGEKPSRTAPGQLADLISSNMPEIWHNDMTGDVMFGEQPLPICELDFAYSRLGSLGWRIPTQDAKVGIRQSAWVRRRHPIREYLESCRTPLPDGAWADVANYLLGPGHSPFDSAVMRKWLIFAVARAFQPGCPFGIMLVLAGAQQSHKTRFFNTLASDKWFLGGFQRTNSDKDDLIALHRSWIAEWGELDGGLNKHSSAELKAMIDRKEDIIRRPYAAAHETCPRGFVLCGTTNKMSGLFTDETGNRRYAVVKVLQQIDSARLEGLRDHVWASAMRDYRNGQTWYLSDEELAINNDTNLQLVKEDPWHGEVVKALYHQGSDAVRTTSKDLLCTTATWILEHVIKMDKDRWTQAHYERVASILQAVGCVKSGKHTVQPRRGETRSWRGDVWLVPPAPPE